MLISQGEHGDRAWLIQSGKLEIARVQPGTREVWKFGATGPGSLVGEMALIDPGPRSAHVRCATDVVAMEVTRADFDRMLQQSRPLATWLLTSLVGAIRGAYGLTMPEPTEARSADIRSGRSSPGRSSPGRSSQSVLDRRTFRAEHAFFREGEPGDIAYLIQGGSVSIRKGDKELVLLGPGRIFGELAMLRNEPRGASAIAVDPTTVELIRKVDFDVAIATMPPVLRTLTQTYIERLAAKR
jgi:cAMP-dependent protein kinase regulator